MSTRPPQGLDVDTATEAALPKVAQTKFAQARDRNPSYSWTNVGVLSPVQDNKLYAPQRHRTLRMCYTVRFASAVQNI